MTGSPNGRVGNRIVPIHGDALSDLLKLVQSTASLLGLHTEANPRTPLVINGISGGFIVKVAAKPCAWGNDELLSCLISTYVIGAVHKILANKMRVLPRFPRVISPLFEGVIPL